MIITSNLINFFFVIIVDRRSRDQATGNGRNVFSIGSIKFVMCHYHFIIMDVVIIQVQTNLGLALSLNEVTQWSDTSLCQLTLPTMSNSQLMILRVLVVQVGR